MTLELLLTPPTPIAAMEVRERTGAFVEHVPLSTEGLSASVVAAGRRLARRLMADYRRELREFERDG